MHTFKNNVEVNTVYYQDNIEIRNNDVIVNHSNGRIVYENGGGDGEYQYYLKDHLGNVRLTFSKCSEVQLAMCKNDDITVINENHYYPFGMKMEGDWNSNNTTEPKVTNQYNGKEWVDDLGLAMNDYGARLYDPAVARWNSVDPLAEKYVGHSPYNYVYNNPVNYIDPDGRIGLPFILKGLGLLWGAIEAGLAAYDIYDAYSTVTDPNASNVNKTISLGGLVLGIVLPGGSYGKLSKVAANDVLKIGNRLPESYTGFD